MLREYVTPTMLVEEFVPNETIAVSGTLHQGDTVTINTNGITVTVTFLGYMSSWHWGTYYASKDSITTSSGEKIYGAYSYYRSDWGSSNTHLAFDGYSGALDGILDYDNSNNLPGHAGDLLLISQAFAGKYTS